MKINVSCDKLNMYEIFYKDTNNHPVKINFSGFKIVYFCGRIRFPEGILIF